MKYSFLAALALIMVYIPLACLDYHHLPYSDAAEHGAAVQELARNLRAPEEPMLHEYCGKSPRFVPSAAVMAAAVRLLGIDVLTAIKIFSVVFFLFLLFSIAFFSREYFQDPHQASWSIACMLFLWGTGWFGSNAYMFSALIHTAWYPSLVAFACTFMALAYACRYLRKPNAAALAGCCLFGAAAFVNHPLTALFFWAGAFLLCIEIKGLRALFQPWFAAVIGASICAMALWPYYDFFANALTISRGSMGGAWDYALTRAYLYSDIIQRTGPALVAVPVLLFYTFKRKHTMLTGLCLVSLCIYTAGFFLRISLAERFIFATIFSSQILVSRCAWSLAQTLRNSTATTMHTACYALITLLLAAGCAGQLYLTAREYIQPGFTFSTDAPYIRYQDPTAMHKQFARYMHPGDIVFSDVPTSWGIPLYTGAKIVSLFHTPPHVRDNDARKTEVKRFYDPLTNNQQRLHILKKFNATKLVVHYPVAGENIRKQIDAMDLPRIMHNDTVDIFEVPNDAAFPASTDLHSDSVQ